MLNKIRLDVVNITGSLCLKYTLKHSVFIVCVCECVCTRSDYCNDLIQVYGQLKRPTGVIMETSFSRR